MDDGVGSEAGLAAQVKDRAVRAALKQCAAAQDGRFRPLPGGRPEKGHSGAILFPVMFTRSTGGPHPVTRKLIVKVLPVGSTRREVGRHDRAYHSVPSFASRHLVRRHGLLYPVGDGRHLMFQEIANGGDRVCNLDKLGDAHRVEAVRLVVHGVLHDWNGSGEQPIPGDLPIKETEADTFVRRELKAMRSLKSVRDAARRLGVPDLDAEWLTFDGEELPNPYRLLDGSSSLHDVTVAYVYGFSHGDLHGGNAMVPVSATGVPDLTRFFLVDYTYYSAKAPLTRDVLALLLSSVLSYLPLPEDQEDGLLRCLLDPEAGRPPRLPSVLAELIEAVHEVGTAYATGWDAEWQKQCLLSLISQALLCTTFDNLGSDRRRWCLRLAATATATFAQRADVTWAARSTEALAVPSRPDAAPAPRHDLRHLDLSATSDHLAAPLLVELDGSAARRAHRPDATSHAEGVRNFRYVHPARPTGNGPAARNAARTAARTSNGRQIPGQRAADKGVPTLEQVLRDSHPLNAGPAPQVTRRGSRAWFRRRWREMTAVGVGGLVGVTLLVWPLPGGRREPDTVPTVQLPPTEVPRGVPAPDRNSARTAPTPEPTVAGRRLADLAVQVQGRDEPAAQGRYTYTCVRVWSPDTVDRRPVGPKDYRQYQLWWTAQGSGRERVTTVVNGMVVGRPQVSRYAPGEWRAGRPLPEQDPSALRDQLDDLYADQPPEVQNPAGMVLLVVRFHRYHVLTPAQQSAMLLVLSGTPGLAYRGEYVDRAGRVGMAVSADDREGRRETVLFDPDTGELLAHETTDTQQQVLAYHLFVSRTRTDTSDDRSC